MFCSSIYRNCHLRLPPFDRLDALGLLAVLILVARLAVWLSSDAEDPLDASPRAAIYAASVD